ncbi:MAG TPA: hypothetical protein VFU93_01090 [Acidimicrobiales bacterium]|nr:hypothetical protein [Acidimicrobiales bacterium]
MLSALQRRLHRSLRDERGSVLMAVLATTVGAFALIAVGNAVNGGLSTARADQNRINAFQHANAGIDLALYRIDRGDFSGPSIVAITDGFRDTVTVGDSTFVVEAVRAVPGKDHTWNVRSTGTDGSGRQRMAVATIATERLFNHGFFTIQDFSLTGNQLTPLAYDSAVCPDPTLDPEGCNIDPIPGRLGTNAEFVGAAETVDDFKDRWDGFDMYGRATQEAADQACGAGRCGTAPEVRAISNQMPTILPVKPAGILPCPFGGIVVNQTLTPGDYLCSSLNLEGVVTVGTGGNGSGRVRIWVDGAFSAADDAEINKGQPTPKLQIFQAETEGGGAYNGSICGAEIWALLYAPGLVIDCNGSHQPVIFGAVVAQLHGGTGAHFDFHWDIASIDETFDEKYVVLNWRECPVGTTTC